MIQETISHLEKHEIYTCTSYRTCAMRKCSFEKNETLYLEYRLLCDEEQLSVEESP